MYKIYTYMKFILLYKFPYTYIKPTIFPPPAHTNFTLFFTK